MANAKNLRPSWDKKTKFPSLMTYVKEEDLKAILHSKSEQIEFCEYIFHDKDPKVPHFHVVLSLKKPRYVSEIIGWFARCIDDSGNPVNTMGKPTRSCADMDDYLTHKNDSTKHQYIDTDIKVLIGNRAEYREMQTEYQAQEEKEAQKAFEKEALADDIEQELQDCIDGVPFREMARRYGRDYIKNWKSYKEYASNVVFEETLDVSKALAVQSSALDVAMIERERECLSSGYKAGTKDALNALYTYVSAQVEHGATYLKDIEKLIFNMKTDI